MPAVPLGGLCGRSLPVATRRFGPRFFRLFLYANKEKIAGSDFWRNPRRGEAQGCVEQTDSGSSPCQIKDKGADSRPKFCAAFNDGG